MIDIPKDYIIEQLYRYGYQVTHNRSNDSYQFGCPVCREGKSLGKKRRCFFIPKNNNIFCHNCGWSSTPFNWIKKVSGISDDLLFEEIKSFDNVPTVDILLKEKENTIERHLPDIIPGDSIDILDSQQVSHHIGDKIIKLGLSILSSRKLQSAVNRPKSIYISKNDKVHKNRLIIPFFNEKNELEFYQSRTMLMEDNATRPKYLSKIGGDKTLYGMNNISNDLNYIFIFEGPINAMFVKNGVAVAGIQKGNQQFTKRQKDQIDIFKWHEKIWVLDSQWIDETSLVKTEILLEQGEKVFIWPEHYGKVFKDFNDISIKYDLSEVSNTFIKENTYEGIVGILKLAEIKRFKS